MTSAFNAGREIVGRMLTREATDKLLANVNGAPLTNSLPASYAADDPEVWAKLAHITIEDI